MVQTVAVGTDGSGTADKAVEFAIDMAARYEARIVFISAYVPVRESRLSREARDAPGTCSGRSTRPRTSTRRCASARSAPRQKGLRWASEAREGDPAKILVELAESNDADVLVIGNKGMQRKLLGSVPNSVSHNAPCSVMIVKTT